MLPDGHARIQAAHRILKNDLHVFPQVAKRFSFVRVEVFALEMHRAARGRLQAQDRAANRRLTATGFTHESEGLPLRKSKLTPSTAFTWPTVRANTPRLIGK